MIDSENNYNCNIHDCNIYEAQKYIKHKWMPITIFLIGKEKKQSFSCLLNKIEYISNKRLSEVLKTLLNGNIIKKENDNYYVLTTKGDHLYEIILLMSNFEN